MGARFVRRAGGVDDAEIARLVDLQQRGQGWVQAEEAVQVQGAARAGLIRPGDVDGRPATVIFVVPMRHDDVEAVGAAA